MKNKKIIRHKNPNAHIVDYLSYYFDLVSSPEYAILLKGEWGSGKTWFIRNFLKKFEENKDPTLYVSLYGVSTFSEIEDQFFQQLHPFLSSKGMSISGKILKGLLKASLKIDLDDDGKDDGTVSASFSEINIPDYLKGANKKILIFDDLERCKIPYDEILGYINYFVEHQSQKVIIIANENEIISQQDCDKEIRYKRIKEKLIGKTFKVEPNTTDAFDHFTSLISDVEVKKIIINRKVSIVNAYYATKYNNLRNLKQAIWDFERLYKIIPGKYRSNVQFVNEIIEQLIPLSIEIRQGVITPEQIMKIARLNTFGFNEKSKEQKVSEAKNILYVLKEKHPIITSYSMIPNEYCWYEFFERGIIDEQDLIESLSNSHHFKSKSEDDWIKLWNFPGLKDEEFEILLNKVTSNFYELKYKNTEVIRHITGIFLQLSDYKLISLTKNKIMKKSIEIIDKLFSINELIVIRKSEKSSRHNDSYNGLMFLGRDLKEFISVSAHIRDVENKLEIEGLKLESNNLLNLVSLDPEKYRIMTTLSNSVEQKYFDKPILVNISCDDYFNELCKLNPDTRRTIGYALVERYKFNDICLKLTSELKWLRELKKIVGKEAQKNKGKLSGLLHRLFIVNFLDKAISNLSLSTIKGSEVKFKEKAAKKSVKPKSGMKRVKK